MGANIQNAINKAKSLIQTGKYNINGYTNLEHIAEDNNLLIFHINFDEIGVDDLKNVSGCIVYKAKKIYINNRDISVRQRFTLAHELGHFILEHSTIQSEGGVYIDNGISYRDSGLTEQPEEIDANNFAAELLMPDYLVRKQHSCYISPFVSDLATYFRVSKMAMRIRLEKLGLVYYDF